MRICLDLSAAVRSRTGVGRYTQELGRALIQNNSADEYIALCNRADEANLDRAFSSLPRLTVKVPDKAWRMRVMLAHLLRVPQDRFFKGVDLLHATDNLVPLFSSVSSVFTLYDLAFRHCPGTHTRLNRWYLGLMMPHFLKKSDVVIAISEHTKKDAMRLYGVDDSKVRVIYPGVDSSFRPPSPEEILSVRGRYSLPANFILSVGTLEPRKNLVRLLEAYAALKEEERNGKPGSPKLVIAGKRGWLYQGFFAKLRELKLEEDVIFPGFIPDEDLSALYGAAALFVFPSLYEGFGLPVVEAMACGTPVVCSNTSSLPEAAGDAALMVDPLETEQLARAILRVISDDGVRHEMCEKGLRQAAKFSWEKARRETLEVYRQVAGARLAKETL